MHLALIDAWRNGDSGGLLERIERITLTGADERTSLDQLWLLATTFPAVEVGLLYTESPEGRNRYPSLHWLSCAAARLSGRVAIHVCGRAARERFAKGDLDDLVQHAPRVQVNGHVEQSELVQLAGRAGTLITQHNEANAALIECEVNNHSILIDNSGGRGISPAVWPRLVTAKPVGRAGGLGPHNLEAEMQDFELEVAPGGWIDMEGKLRTDDWFDLKKAWECASIHARLCQASQDLVLQSFALPATFPKSLLPAQVERFIMGIPTGMTKGALTALAEAAGFAPNWRRLDTVQPGLYGFALRFEGLVIPLLATLRQPESPEPSKVGGL